MESKITDIVVNKTDECRPLPFKTSFVLNTNKKPQQLTSQESKSYSELIQNETNVEDNQEKDFIDVISSKMDKLDNVNLNSNNIDQKSKSVEPKSSTNEDLCTVDSNKHFSKLYAEDSQEKMCAKKSSSKIDKTEKVLLNTNTYYQNLPSVKPLPSTTEKCTSLNSYAKFIKEKLDAENSFSKIDKTEKILLKTILTTKTFSQSSYCLVPLRNAQPK